LRFAEALEELGVPLSVSHKILPEFREYERTSTVVVNAYLQPLMAKLSVEDWRACHAIGWFACQQSDESSAYFRHAIKRRDHCA